MSIYAKVLAEAKLEFNEDGDSVPVYLLLQDPPELSDEEIKETIGNLIKVSPGFIVLITQEEYNENVDELLDVEEFDGHCSGCGKCCGNCHKD